MKTTKSSLTWIEKNFFGVSFTKIPTLFPGLVFTGLLAWFSIWFSDVLGKQILGFEKSPVSSVMMAILLGIIISNLIHLPKLFYPGFSFAVKKVLRLGIILLGIRLSILEVFRLGVVGIPIVLICIAGALFFTILLARWMKLPEKLGTLIGVGTSICGVSAIVAAGPAIEAKEEEMAYAVSIITIFGIFATLVYPYLASILFAGDPIKAGLFLGTSVHDTSQVTGAGLVYSEVFGKPEALNAAVVTKLVRNIFMIIVIPFMAFYYSRNVKEAETAGEGTKKEAPKIIKLFPLFIIGFLLFAVLRSVGDITASQSGSAFGLFSPEAWSGLYGGLKTWAVHFLVVALAGVGLSTRFRQLKALGIKPFFIGLLAALIVGAISFGIISLLGKFISI